MALTTGVGLLLGGLGALDSFAQGRSMKNEALRGLEEFEAQQLINPFESLSPSLEAERTALRTGSERLAGFVDVSRGQNAAEAMAMISTGAEQVGASQRGVIDSMMKQQAEFDVMEAKDETNIRGIQEARDRFIVDSLRQQLAAGTQQQMNALLGGAKMFAGVGLAQEDRIAGLGIDPIAARKQRIAEGTATFEDFLYEGMLGDAFGKLGGK